MTTVDGQIFTSTDHAVSWDIVDQQTDIPMTPNDVRLFALAGTG